jgi:hypothetical protein
VKRYSPIVRPLGSLKAEVGRVLELMESEAERKPLAARSAVEKKVREAAEREFKRVGSYLDRASSEADRRRRLSEVTALVSKRVVRSFYEKHPNYPRPPSSLSWCQLWKI